MRACCLASRASTRGVAAGDGAAACAKAPIEAMARVAPMATVLRFSMMFPSMCGVVLRVERVAHPACLQRQTGRGPTRRAVKMCETQRPCRAYTARHRLVRRWPTSTIAIDSESPRMISREPTIERLAVARSLLLEPFGLTEAIARPRSREHRVAPHRRRRPLLPVHAQRRLEPRGRHRQERQLRHRPGRRRARRRRREDRVRLLRRHLRSRADGCGAHGAHDRRGRPEPARQGRPRDLDRAQPHALRADGSDRHARQRAEGRAARAGREAGPRQGSAHRPGDGRRWPANTTWC